MASSTISGATRRPEVDKPAAILVNPPADRYDYDPISDLPACPDIAPTGAWEMQGTFWEGQFSHGQLRDQRTRYYTKPALDAQVRSLRESQPSLKQARFGQMRTMKLRESDLDWWSYGLSTPPSFGSGLLTTPYIPLLPGPATRQLYWADYFAMSAKAFEASTHNPLAHRATEIEAEFVLGRGIEARCKTDRGQKIWDAFWKLNNMDERIEEILGDIKVYGELFLRYFKQPGRLLKVRSLDPAGIYEVVTDQEDWESVYFYHQQEQERAQLFAPPGGNIAPTGPTSPDAVTRYTIRQIPADEVDHYRINVRSGEVRGRSDLFSALGYLKRLSDLLTSRVIRSDMEARMVFDLMVEGNSSDVSAMKRELFPQGKPPEPAAVFAHNDKTKLAAFQFTSQAQADDGSVEEMVEMCALGTGVSRQYLWTAGKGSGGARAGALVATEPGQKRFEKRQRLVQRILQDMAARVFQAAGSTGEDAEVEFIFPSIAVEESSAALKDLAFAESMGWISKRTAATMGARQQGIETFDYDTEQEAIAEEFEHTEDEEEETGETKTNPVTGETEPETKKKQGDGVIRRPMMNAGSRQAPKLDPTKASSQEDQPPGLLMPAAGGSEAGPPGVETGAPTAPGRAGFPADENPLTSAGKKNIQQDNLRESETVAIVRVAIQEAARAGARIPRRRPTDPDFQTAAQEYHTQTDQHVAALASSIHPAVKP
jgi:hypothetical protein